MLPDDSDHAAVSKWVMYIIAAMIGVCMAIVLAFKGVSAMPHDAIGIVGAVAFMVAAIGTAIYVQRQQH